MEERARELSKYRFETSLEALSDAKIMYENERYKNTLNRAYYAIFHAIRAVNALRGFDSSKHSGVIAYFNQNYVKEGIFSKELSKIIRMASENREKADYLDFLISSSLSSNSSSCLILLFRLSCTPCLDIPSVSAISERERSSSI